MLCENKTFLNIFAQGIIQEGGEGVVLRRPYSGYIHGRSSSLVKFKVVGGVGLVESE